LYLNSILRPFPLQWLPQSRFGVVAHVPKFAGGTNTPLEQVNVNEPVEVPSVHSKSQNESKKEGPPVQEEEEEKPPIPEMNGHSAILSEEDIRFLCAAMPSKEFTTKWTLLFNSTKNGKSFNRFCFHVTGRGPTVIILRDQNGHIFGAFASETWKDKHPKYYGTAHSFLYKLKPNRIIYKPTGFNDHYQYLNQGTETLFNGIGMGGQTEFFTWSIAEDFETGKCRGNPSSTYGCPPISSVEDWNLDYVEVWEVKELTDLTYEQEKILKKKNKAKSVLDDDDNAEKVITGMLGHNFTVLEKQENNENKQEEGGHQIILTHSIQK